MSGKKVQPVPGHVEKGNQPVSRKPSWGSILPTDNGYQPSSGNLDVRNPPTGGSGVPKSPPGGNATPKGQTD